MNKVWIDPPSGWRYGFPKVWDPEINLDFRSWLIESGYPEPEVDFAMNYCRQWNVEETETKAETKTEIFKGLQEVRKEFQRWEQTFEEERDVYWNSLTHDQQLLAFCAVVNKLVQGELVDCRSYRGVLYDVFGFDESSYVCAQVSGFLDLHNSIERKS